MTNEEAKAIMLSDADFSGIGEKAKLTADALCMAIEALEKQIPKKPIYVETSDNEFMDYVCPICNGAIELEPRDHSKNTWCLHCGQRLDWSRVTDMEVKVNGK